MFLLVIIANIIFLKQMQELLTYESICILYGDQDMQISLKQHPMLKEAPAKHTRHYI